MSQSIKQPLSHPPPSSPSTATTCPSSPTTPPTTARTRAHWLDSGVCYLVSHWLMLVMSTKKYLVTSLVGPSFRNVLCQSQLSILQPSVRRGAEPSPRLVPHHRQLCHPRSRLPPRRLCLHRGEVRRLFCFFYQMYQLLTNACSRCCIRDYKPVSPM